jgi:hypothetical protein
MYNPKPKPLEGKIKEVIDETDFEKSQPMLIGWDVYVDIDGNVGFYEGNSCPFALGDYESMFGNDLSKNLAKSMKNRGIIGINIDLETAGGARAYNGGVAKSICERYGLEYLMGHSDNLRWSSKDKKFYFETEGGRKEFDLLFNRYPPFCRESFNLVPKTDWKHAPVISPIPIMKILANKITTTRALESMGLDFPFCMRVENKKQYLEAAERVMQHIRDNHPNYEPPFILSKPVAGTGANGIRVFKELKKIDLSKIIFPCMVCERISVYPLEESDGNHMIDTRMFYVGQGHASHGIGRVAPMSINGRFTKESYITNLCKGGHTSQIIPEAEKILQQYVLAATIAVTKYQSEILKR